MSKTILLGLLLSVIALAPGCNKQDDGGKTGAPGERAATEDSRERGPSRTSDESRTSRKDRDRDKDEDKKTSSSDRSDDKSSSKSSDDELGIKVCDDYVKRVKSCATGPKDSSVFKKLLERWRKAIDDGQSSKVEEACAKADKVFQCKA